MRSTRALVAAAAIVLSYPLAVAVQLLFGRGTGRRGRSVSTGVHEKTAA